MVGRAVLSSLCEQRARLRDDLAHGLEGFDIGDAEPDVELHFGGNDEVDVGERIPVGNFAAPGVHAELDRVVGKKVTQDLGQFEQDLFFVHAMQPFARGKFDEQRIR